MGPAHRVMKHDGAADATSHLVVADTGRSVVFAGAGRFMLGVGTKEQWLLLGMGGEGIGVYYDDYWIRFGGDLRID